MNNLQHILQVVFRKESLDEVSVEELEQASTEHPLFAPLHFLLARKYKQTGNELYEKQIRKTALHFHNPLWLHYQLSQSLSNGYGSEQHQPAREVMAPPPEVLPVAADDTSRDMIEEVVVHQELETPSMADRSVSALAQNDTRLDTAVTDDAHVGEMYNTNPESEAIKMEESEAKETLRAHNDLQTADAGTGYHTVSPPADLPEPQEKLPAPQHPLFSKGSEEEAEQPKITFEPFHTVDYFASQGIRINQEIKSDDRLGKQMKSFTEWLKTMRKLPEASVQAELEKINDREIESIAAHSLEEKEVVTEAMAEVYAKQGLHGEARAVYEKLSLRNPAKSAYFAAKIEALKNQ
jgi:hypothetical protein